MQQINLSRIETNKRLDILFQEIKEIKENQNDTDILLTEHFQKYDIFINTHKKEHKKDRKMYTSITAIISSCCIYIILKMPWGCFGEIKQFLIAIRGNK